MKIKILKLIAGPAGVFQPDTTVDIDEKLASDIVKAGAGIYIDEKKEINKKVEIETEEIEVPEEQVILKKKKKR